MAIYDYIKPSKPVVCECCGKPCDVDRDLAEMAGWEKDCFGDWACPECLRPPAKVT